MNGRWWVCAVIVACATLVGGCTTHNVKYVGFIKARLQPTAQAVAIDGYWDEARRLFEQAQLPHNTARQRYELQCEGVETLTSQLGSRDYALIGEIYGGGNARATLQTLKAKFCKEAAKNGGDVVMIIQSGVEQRPFVFSTPGYSTTNLRGSVYGSGNYAYGSGTAHTTYMPGQTYAGTLYLPHANGLVFRHVPGAQKRREAISALDDEALGRAVEQIDALNDPSLTFAEAMRQADRIIAEANNRE